MSPPRVGLAVSGGGFRATAFALGAMRALHDRDMLKHVRVISGISGGGLLTAMYAYGPIKFSDFDGTVRDLLSRGLQRELLLRAMSPRRLFKQIKLANSTSSRWHWANRSESLVDAIRERPFGSAMMSEPTINNLEVVISATDLASYSAMRFGSMVSACSPYGKVIGEVPVADAVAASAAFPALLPALNRRYLFEDSAGNQTHHTLTLTDGGVHDNLGLTPLMPGRSKVFTAHSHELDYLISIDAAKGRAVGIPRNLLVARLAQSFDVAHTRAQDGGRAAAYDALARGQIEGLVHAYLGMNDSRAPRPLADLVPRSATSTYATNFAAMQSANMKLIVTRGEQLTRLLVDEYMPGL